MFSCRTGQGNYSNDWMGRLKIHQTFLESRKSYCWRLPSTNNGLVLSEEVDPEEPQALMEKFSTDSFSSRGFLDRSLLLGGYWMSACSGRWTFYWIFLYSLINDCCLRKCGRTTFASLGSHSVKVGCRIPENILIVVYELIINFFGVGAVPGQNHTLHTISWKNLGAI